MSGTRSSLCVLVSVALVLVLAGCEAFDRKATAEYEEAMKVWNSGNHRAANVQFTELAKAHPFSPHADNALYWVGMTQFLYLGETDKALTTLNLVLKKYPHRDSAPSAQLVIAQIYELGYNDYPRAADEYRKAADYSDREVREKSLYSLGELLSRMGKQDEAKEAWLRQTKEFPAGALAPPANYRLGTAAFAQGDLAGAERYYRKTLDAGPEPDLTLKAKYALANCLEADERLTDALKLYKELEPLYPNREALDIKIKALETRIIKKSY